MAEYGALSVRFLDRPRPESEGLDMAYLRRWLSGDELEGLEFCRRASLGDRGAWIGLAALEEIARLRAMATWARGATHPDFRDPDQT